MSFSAHLASEHFTVTPSDTDQPKTFYGLYIGVAGDVLVKDVNDVVCTYKVAAPGYLWIKGKAVMAATSATNIVGLLK